MGLTDCLEAHIPQMAVLEFESVQHRTGALT